MSNFSQKYTIVSFLDRSQVSEGHEFDSTNWPLHTTLADVFSVGRSLDDLLTSLDTLCQNLQNIDTKVVGFDHFGESKDINVLILDNTKRLNELHYFILESLSTVNASFNHPEYTGAGFVPHITVDSLTDYSMNDTFNLDNIAVVDMFPEKDPYRRRVLYHALFLK